MKEPLESKQVVSDLPDPTIEDTIPEWKELCDRITNVFKFFRTRQRVLAGEPLWNMSKGLLENEHLMEPWAFNIYQLIVSSAPGAAISAFLLLYSPFNQYAF